MQYKLKWKTDLEKGVLVTNFERRGWTRATTEDEWNVYWALPWTVKGKIFNPDSGLRGIWRHGKYLGCSAGCNTSGLSARAHSLHH